MDGIRTVVVNTDLDVCQLVGALLEAQGACVQIARQTQEALDLIHTHSAEVLFTDLSPSGADVLRRGHQSVPDLATVVVADSASLDSAVEALRLGACDYVTKPLTRDKTLAAWHRALEHRKSRKRSSGASQGSSLLTTRSRSHFLQCPSRAMRSTLEQAKRLAALDVPVQIKGETGVGKRLLGEFIHSSSFRQGLVGHLACDGIPEGGLEPGGFNETGPVDRPERQPLGQPFSDVRGGTLVAREITALPWWAQVQLQDIIEGQCVPGSQTPAAVRLVATSTDDLDQAAAQGRLCRGLYDILSAAVIRAPPLRERPEDIRPLAEYFLQQYEGDRKRTLVSPATGRKKSGAASPSLAMTNEEWQWLSRYHWPGNIRELASLVRRLALAPDARQRGSILRDLATGASQTEGTDHISVPLAGGLKQIERYVIREVVKRHDGNKAAAARFLRLHRRTMYRIMASDARSRGT